MMKQEAALRRERALAYAFSHQASSYIIFLVLLVLNICSYSNLFYCSMHVAMCLTFSCLSLCSGRILVEL
jgi:hypothetical protein